MAAVYSTAQAAKLTGVSEGTVRNYVRAPQYAAHFSQGANPPAGAARRLTDQDLALLAYIREQTAAGVTHDQIAARIEAGELGSFTWSAPEPARVGDTWGSIPDPAARPGDTWGSVPPPQPAPLAIMAQTLTQELAAARQREQELWDRLLASETRAARVEGELAALKGRPWLRRLFGG